MSQTSLLTGTQQDAQLAIVLSFAFAGFVASIFRGFRNEPVKFEMLLLGGSASVAAIPLLVAAGPAVIMRNTIRGRKYERRKVHLVAIATVLASLWSMAIGYQLMHLIDRFAS